MAEFANTDAIIDAARKFREQYSAQRVNYAMYAALADAYAIGNQWRTVQSNPLMRDASGKVWNTNYDIGSRDLRVVDNKLAPLVRRAIADMQPATIEPFVTSLGVYQDRETHDLARICEDALEALSTDIAYTPAAQRASFLRTIRGSHLLLARLSEKTKTVRPDIARDVDGEPLEINDRWLHWEDAPFVDLVLDPTETNPDLHAHEQVMLDQIMTLRKFERIYGPIKQWGVKKEDLSVIGELASFQAHSAKLTGNFSMAAWNRRRKDKAVRLIQWYISDPNKPREFPICYIILDLVDKQHQKAGILLNDGKNPFGKMLPIDKLDMYLRPDSPHGVGVVHTLITGQDLNNMLVSLEFQQLASNAYGVWVLDVQQAKRDDFINDLNSGAGSVLMYNSRKMNQRSVPPQRLTPTPTDQGLILMQQQLLAGMRDAAHISPQNLGIGKSHVPQKVALGLLEEAGTVKDSVLIRDLNSYGHLMHVTLMSLRRFSNAPNSMLDILQEKQVFDDLSFGLFTLLDVSNPQVRVGIRKKSVILRSVDERIAALTDAKDSKVISPNEFLLAMSDDLNRPIMQFHADQLEACHKAVRAVADGLDWPGSAGFHMDVFRYCVMQAISKLDLGDENDQVIHDLLTQAVVNQIEFDAKQLALEEQAKQLGTNEVQSQRQEDAPLPTTDLATPAAGPPPQSINPAVNVAGAAGGFPLGVTG